jgi:hypothetical protein
MSITLLQLRTQARERADMTNSTFVTDTELNNYINKSIAELYDILVQCYGSDYFTAPAIEFNTIGAQDKYDIPTILKGTYGDGVDSGNTFYKMVALDAKVNSGEWSSVTLFSFGERNRFQRFGIWDRLGITNFRYRMVGNNLTIAPTPTQAGPMRFWYIPAAKVLTADADSFDDINQWSEYVIVDAAIKMLQKEESDVSVLMAEKTALKRRIEEAGNNRDVGKSEAVGDIYAEQDFYWY